MENSLLLVFSGVAGAIWGSFIASLADRICEKGPLFKMRSFCFSCGHPLPAWHLVPVFSYIFLRGQCAFCGGRIALRIFLSEILGAFGVILALFVAENFKDFALLSAFSLTFLFLSLVDLRLKAVPSPALWLAFFLALALKFDPNELLHLLIFEHFKEGFLRDALLFAGFVFLLKSLLQSLKNLKNKSLEDNLGDGDIIILSALAGLFGLKFAFLTLFFASLIALPFFFWMRQKGQKELAFLPLIHAAFSLQLLLLALKGGA